MALIAGNGCGRDGTGLDSRERYGTVQQATCYRNDTALGESCSEDSDCHNDCNPPGSHCCGVCVSPGDANNCGRQCIDCIADYGPGYVCAQGGVGWPYLCEPPVVGIGEDCSDPAEADGCEANGAWAGCCGGTTKTCVNLALDVDNCGACGNHCKQGELCEAGKCMLGKGQFCIAGRTWADAQYGQGSVGACFSGEFHTFNGVEIAPNVLMELECCGRVCVDTAADDYCGDCDSQVDCTGNGPPNDECIRADGSNFCGCDWVDGATMLEQWDATGEITFSEHYFGEICDTTQSNTCLDNALPYTWDNTMGGDPLDWQSTVSIRCGCGTGPACPNGSQCVGSGSSARCEGCGSNEDCPYGQLCRQGSPSFCTVVGCDKNDDCTGYPEAVSGFFDQWLGYTNYVSVTCITKSGNGVGNDGNGALRGALVTDPPSGYSGLCVDVGVDPAYCGASGLAPGAQFTFRPRYDSSFFGMAAETCDVGEACGGRADGDLTEEDDIMCHAGPLSTEWASTADRYYPMPITIGRY